MLCATRGLLGLLANSKTTHCSVFRHKGIQSWQRTLPLEGDMLSLIQWFSTFFGSDPIVTSQIPQRGFFLELLFDPVVI